MADAMAYALFLLVFFAIDMTQIPFRGDDIANQLFQFSDLGKAAGFLA